MEQIVQSNNNICIIYHMKYILLQIQKMSQVGGETIAKNVRNIMSQTIGYEVAQAYTWTGQKKQLSLKKSKLSDAIIGINNII